MEASPQVLWFKRDLRLHDHAPLCAAAQAGPLVALYIIEPVLWQQPDSSLRHWHFIRDSLQELAAGLTRRGGSLLVRTGDAVGVLETLRQDLGDLVLHSHEETGNDWSYGRDRMVAAWCQSHGITWHEYPSHGVVRRLKSRDGWAQLRDTRMAEVVLPVPASWQFLPSLNGDALPPKDSPRFGEPLAGRAQPGGRSQGVKILESFLLDRAKKYLQTISQPGVSARHCSRLSPHIAYGTLSVREIEQATRRRLAALATEPSAVSDPFTRNLAAFLSRLAWRCHFVQKLEQAPDIERRCMHPAFEGMREPYFREDYFEAWKTGQTGYPLVDACMRSLIANGWITFRMRAMLVSFASYHLWLDWRQTAPYLAGLFTDYEPGIHYAQFQMQSGVTGINAVRMYNPVKQSIDNDPHGRFIRRYLPELREVPDAFLHAPWHWHTPPEGYKKPIVVHEDAIRLARQRLGQARQSDDFKAQAKQVYGRLGSRNRARSRTRTPKQVWRQLSLDLE